MHFAYDWEAHDKQWAAGYSNANEEPNEGTAKHRRKFTMLEDAYNKR